jgi:hypothetical protein
MSVSCSHLDSIQVTELPDSIAGCEECLANGGVRGARSVTPTTAASSWTPSEDPGIDQGIPRAQPTMGSVTLVRMDHLRRPR